MPCCARPDGAHRRPRRQRVKQAALDLALDCGPTLDNFFPGANAQVLRHLRLWCAEGTRSPVPIYLWGEAGSGKTHLLRAVAAALQAQGARCGWMDVGTPPGEAFDEGWSVVLLDQVQGYGVAAQHQAFNWFVNAVAPAGGTPCAVLAAGRLPPADLPLREDLRTRLGWGHVFALTVPTEDERRAVLRQQADARGLHLGDEVIAYVLARFPRDLGSLLEWLDQLDRYALRAQRAVTIPLVKEMLQDS